MAKELSRLVCAASVLAMGVMAGCNQPASKPAASGTPATQAAAEAAPATQPAAPQPAVAVAPQPAAKPPETPATPETTDPASAPITPAKPGDVVAATEPNPLFTLPPSKGPAAHQFKQVTLLRGGPSGDLEMQLTGDGIYRIRDHGRGRSYSGNGKLTDEQIAQWADLMKDWKSLKPSYLPDDFAKDADDKIEIIYDGDKVVAAGKGKDTPKTFTEAYKRLLALNEQSQKETEAATAAPAETPKTNP
jgi:hypothetical protein